MATTKICTKCGVEKSLDSFHVRKNGTWQHRALCKQCHNAKSSANRAKRCEPTDEAKSTQTDHLPNSKGCFMMPGPLTPSANAPAWAPLKASDLPQSVLRSGALDHTKYGSRQPDGSVQPYRAPVHECVGRLKENPLSINTATIAKHKKQQGQANKA